MSVQVLVHIVGGYANPSGHTYDRSVLVDAPTSGDLFDWWFDEVYPETGDDVHDNSGSYCTATIAEGPAELVGQKHEWIDEANAR